MAVQNNMATLSTSIPTLHVGTNGAKNFNYNVLSESTGVVQQGALSVDQKESVIWLVTSVTSME